MSAYSDPYDPNRALGPACNCGKHATQSEHDLSDPLAGKGTETLSDRVIESAMVRVLFQRGEDGERSKRPPLVRPGLALDAAPAQEHDAGGNVRPLVVKRKH